MALSFINGIKHRVKMMMVKHELQSDLMIIGEGTYGVEHIRLHSWNTLNRLHVGKFCSIADNFHVYLGGNHDLNLISTYPFGELPSPKMIGPRKGHPKSNGDVVIGNDVWVGSRVTIMSGVSVGDGAVIAANSHVVRNVKAYEVVGGNPANHIKFRFSSRTIKELLDLKWWDFDESKIYVARDLLTTTPDSQVLSQLKKIFLLNYAPKKI